MAETVIPFFVERARGGQTVCKGCGGHCPKGELKMAKVGSSRYHPVQTKKTWYHVDCLMNELLNQPATSKRIESIDDIENWYTLYPEEQEMILQKINDVEKQCEQNNSNYSARVVTNVSPFHSRNAT